MQIIKCLPLAILMMTTNSYANMSGYILNQGHTKVTATSNNSHLPASLEPGQALSFSIKTGASAMVTYSDTAGRGCLFNIFAGSKNKSPDISIAAIDNRSDCDASFNGNEYLLTIDTRAE